MRSRYPVGVGSMNAAVALIAQYRERDLEDFGDFLRVRPQLDRFVHEADERGHEDLFLAGGPTFEAAEHLNLAGLDADFFESFAQRCPEQIGVVAVETSSGEGDLAAMTREPIRTSGVNYAQAAPAIYQRYQYRRRALLHGQFRQRHAVCTRELVPESIDESAQGRRGRIDHLSENALDRVNRCKSANQVKVSKSTPNRLPCSGSIWHSSKV